MLDKKTVMKSFQENKGSYPSQTVKVEKGKDIINRLDKERLQVSKVFKKPKVAVFQQSATLCFF
jgi:hypothetical protein